jgi:hypothetical protein
MQSAAAASVKRSRSRAKRSSGVEGEAVEAMACSGGEVVEGALYRRRCALGVGGVEVCFISGRGSGGGVEDLKHTSGENLLSVERAAHAPDIYIGGQMRDERSVWRVVYYLEMRDTCLVRRVTLLFPMRNTWVPNW